LSDTAEAPPIPAAVVRIRSDFEANIGSFLEAAESKMLPVSDTEKEEAEKGWLFFTSDSASISRLTGATGFRFKPTGNDFIHAATLIIVDPSGKISRYMNGIYFLPFELKMSILDAAEGKTGPTLNRVLQYCYSYDPEGQKYVLNITKVSATLIIFMAVTLLLVLVFFRRKRKTA
jgi:protein SCO1/2